MEQGNKLLRTLFILIWVLVLLHMAAQKLFLYWTYKWLDMPMHFLGGVWVGLAALWLWYYSGYARKAGATQHRPLLVAVAGGLFFGLVWECYDFLVWTVGGVGIPVHFFGDTILDLCMDILGAIAAYGLFKWLNRRHVLDMGV